MLIKWLGHASFLIKTDSITIITDPFDEKSGYIPYQEAVDIAMVSHQHYDHNATHVLAGNPLIVDNTDIYSVPGLTIKGILTYHDQKQGQLRGENIVYKIRAENMELVHLGDLGHVPTPDMVSNLGQIDVLFIPVGGRFTIDAQQALQTVELLQPSMVIPMHYQTPHLSFALAPVEDFTQHFDRVVKLPLLEIAKADLTGDRKIVLLDYLSQ